MLLERAADELRKVVFTLECENDDVSIDQRLCSKEQPRMLSIASKNL